MKKEIEKESLTEKVKRVIVEKGMIGKVEIFTEIKKAKLISSKDGELIAVGDELLLIECLKIMLSIRYNVISRHNARVWINKILRKVER